MIFKKKDLCHSANIILNHLIFLEIGNISIPSEGESDRPLDTNIDIIVDIIVHNEGLLLVFALFLSVDVDHPIFALDNKNIPLLEILFEFVPAHLITAIQVNVAHEILLAETAAFHRTVFFQSLCDPQCQPCCLGTVETLH